MIRIVAPARLHFGLFNVASGVPPAGARAFGGAGLMIDAPAVVVTVQPADAWQFEGPLASRAQGFAMRFMESLPGVRRAFRLLVEQCPAEHTGLGVGTQLGLSVAAALVAGCDMTGLNAADLAGRIGRGERSGIGIHGFERGGFLIDDGKGAGEAISPMRAHAMPPGHWRVVLFHPPVGAGWHGERERAAFNRAGPSRIERLRELAESVMAPAVRIGDADAFGEAVHEFNRLAGEPFAAVQGGPYSSPAVAELIAELRGFGVRGAGQSSWGPTVFAVLPDEETARALVLRFRGRMPVSIASVSAGRTVERQPA